MSGAFKNVCSICGKPFHEQEKAVITAMVTITQGGYPNLQHHGGPITSDRVQVRFRTGTKRSIAHAACTDGKGF